MDTAGTVNILHILLIGSIGMLVLAAAVVFFFLRYHVRSSRAMEERHAMEKSHQQELIHTNLYTLEQERKRFAEDLHDEIGASLSAIRLHAGRLENEAENTAVREQVREMKRIIDQSMASTRRISHNILPPGLDMFGLAHVLEDLKKQVAPGVEINIVTMPGLHRLAYDVELTLYRILQELLNNTLKHARASEIHIRLFEEDDLYTITYSDNGIGFDADKVLYTGLGLSNIQNRAKMVNGHCRFFTSPGNGLRVDIMIPRVREG